MVKKEKKEFNLSQDSTLYQVYLKKISDTHPDLYIKLLDYPDATIVGIMNDMISSKLNLDDNNAVKKFFSTRLHLIKIIEVL